MKCLCPSEAENNSLGTMKELLSNVHRLISWSKGGLHATSTADMNHDIILHGLPPFYTSICTHTHTHTHTHLHYSCVTPKSVIVGGLLNVFQRICSSLEQVKNFLSPVIEDCFFFFFLFHLNICSTF